jgi:hypothetical protein
MTIVITTSCHHCGRRVEDAMHVMLCDSCLDARLAQLEPLPARALGAAVFAAFAAFDRRLPAAV